LRSEPLDDVGNRLNKRLFDIVVSSLVTILILSWMVPLLGLLIKLESRGPIFFVQKRSGKDNKPFGCLKFRSMRVNADADKVQAVRNDARITRLGRFLRKTNLDEFPQFLNVLMGDMSVVGPRPHMLKHTDDYSKLINQYMVRQFLKPGITGWAQVNGYRGETKTVDQMKARVEYDLWYMENWSVWLDTRIMFLTVYNIFKGEENAF
jgi:putative colanic acid biosynthesis UDP-glucose lipid carrier transferase